MFPTHKEGKKETKEMNSLPGVTSTPPPPRIETSLVELVLITQLKKKGTWANWDAVGSHVNLGYILILDNQ